MNDLFDLPNIDKGAVISLCEKYRYRLWRVLRPDVHLKTCLFIMLNPSTADAYEDDPTIRRCMRFASEWDYTMLDVVNLFSVRCTEPKLLPHHLDQLCGPDHGYHLSSALLSADLVVCAWGKETGTQRPRAARNMLSTIRDHDKIPMYLKLNKDRTPTHPLYLKADLRPLEYTVCGKRGFYPHGRSGPLIRPVEAK